MPAREQRLHPAAGGSTSPSHDCHAAPMEVAARLARGRSRAGMAQHHKFAENSLKIWRQSRIAREQRDRYFRQELVYSDGIDETVLLNQR